MGHRNYRIDRGIRDTSRQISFEFMVAGDDARSRVSAVSGGSDAIGPSYGPIDIVR